MALLSWSLSEEHVQGRAQTIYRYDTLHVAERGAILLQEEEMRSRLETIAPLCVLCIRLCNVQIQKVDLPREFLLEPVHDGRHCLAPQSAGVKELDELRSSRRRESADTALVIPDAVASFCDGVSVRCVSVRGQKHPCGGGGGNKCDNSDSPFHDVTIPPPIGRVQYLGASGQEIGQRLYLSTRTVDHHVSAVLRKLHVGSRAAAVKAYRKMSQRFAVTVK
jgi:hypothetical protein